MSDDLKKKEEEMKILKMVFGDNIVCEENEQPDFILNYGSNVRHGVEITELNYDGTSARINNKRYIKELLERKKYWHKDDKKRIKFKEAKYYGKEKGDSPIVVPMLFLPKYNMRDYTEALKQTLESKNMKLKKYCCNVSKNCILVIYDKENPFQKLYEQDIARQLFVADLSKVIRESNYEEIYLITEIKGTKRYIPLKAYLLLSDFLLFMEFIKKENLVGRLEEKYNLPLLAFAEILKRRGNTVVFGQVDNDEILEKMVVYCGMYGIGMGVDDNNSCRVGVFDIYPLQNIVNTAESELETSTDFFDDTLYMAYENLVQKEVASVNFFFPIK